MTEAEARAPGSRLEGPAAPEAGRRIDRRYVLAFLMITAALAAVEGTIVATAMPSIVASLGGFEYYSWVFAAYLLSQAVSTPIFGRLADIHGRKPVLLIGITAFLAASVACGFATSMPMLVFFRLLQGLGAGSTMTIVSTLAGDLYEVHERGRVQAYLSSVWGVSAVLGPLLGGALVEHANWSWIFWFNVPIGVIAIAGLRAFLHEEPVRRTAQLDLVSAGLLFVAIGAMMLLFTQGPVWGWPSSLALASLSAVAGWRFFTRQLRVSEPLISSETWNDRLLLLANVVTLGAGMLMIGLVTYSPTYVQGVMGYSPTIAGLTLTAMSFGWTLASAAAGRLVVPLGPALTGRLGGVFAFVGGLMYLLLTPERGPLWVAASSAVVGLGLGFLMTTTVVTIQTLVSWQRRGTATATNLLMRILGNSVGAALLGGVLNVALKRQVASMPGVGDSAAERATALAQIERLLTPGYEGTVDPGLNALLASGLHVAYIGVFSIGVVVLVLSFMLPRSRRLV
ncbi:MAG: MDR family MFS transporter [Trueperaceae bacterium]